MLMNYLLSFQCEFTDSNQVLCDFGKSLLAFMFHISEIVQKMIHDYSGLK